jgi:hypothetical protein
VPESGATRRAAAGVAAVAALVLVASGVPRAMLASGALPEFLRPIVWSDVLFTYLRGLSGHRLPYVDTPFEYPPLVGILSGALSLVVSTATAYVVAWVVVTGAFAAAGAFVLAREAGSRRALAYWALTPQLLLLGGINFDVLPAALVAVAAVATRRGWHIAAAASLAAGAAAKLYPLASLPLAILRAKGRIAATAVAFAVLAVFYLPTMFLAYSSLAGLGFYAVGISSNLDSVWGIVERALAAMGVSDTQGAILLITFIGLVATYVLRVVPRGLRASDPAVAFLLATVALLFWSRLYSPQYSLWLLPFFVLLPLGARLFALLCVADIGVFFTIYPLTLVQRGADDQVGAILLAALAAFVVLRHAALIAVWRAATRLA